MSDLEDFEIERTRDDDASPAPYRPEPPEKPRGLLFPTTVALAAVVAIGLLGVLFFVFRSPGAPAPAPSLAPPLATPTAADASPEPIPPVVLPALEESDPFVRGQIQALSSNAELARWLGRSRLVRTLTVVVLNVASGDTPRPHLEFLAPGQRFAARRSGGRLVPDPAGFAGYDAIAAAVASVDAGAAAGTYRTLEPLFDAAFEEFGQPGVRFRSVLDQAIANLLAVPVLDDDVLLVPHATVFQYADPRLERLTPAQKQFLRMGPGNVRRVQGRLREIATALELPNATAARR